MAEGHSIPGSKEQDASGHSALNFGGVTNEKEAYGIMDADLDAGVTFSDTANVYGGASDRAAVPGSRTARNPERAARRRNQLEAFSTLCREVGKQEAKVALAWTLHHPAVTAPIIGPRHPAAV